MCTSLNRQVKELLMEKKKYEVRISPSTNIPAFFTRLKTNQVKLSSIHMHKGYTYFTTDRKGLKQVRKYRRPYRLKLQITSLVEDEGLTKVIGSYRFFIFLLIPFICSFFLWSVTVESEMPEVTERIEQKLKKTSIVPYRLLTKIPDETAIRRSLMQDDPSLSWVYFNRSGTTLTVIPMLSPTLEKKDEKAEKPADLVARTSGIITRFLLTKGERATRISSTVKKGDLLATGTLEQGDHTVVVGAEGKVYADYWMEYHFTLPKTVAYKMQGEEEIRLRFNAPWKGKGLFNRENWNIIETERIVKEKDVHVTIQKGMEDSFIIPLLKMKLLQKVGPEAVIKEEKLLQVIYDDDKVSGTVLFFMNDNIAMKRPITKETEAID